MANSFVNKFVNWEGLLFKKTGPKVVSGKTLTTGIFEPMSPT